MQESFVKYVVHISCHNVIAYEDFLKTLTLPWKLKNQVDDRIKHFAPNCFRF